MAASVALMVITLPSGSVGADQLSNHGYQIKASAGAQFQWRCMLRRQVRLVGALWTQARGSFSQARCSPLADGDLSGIQGSYGRRQVWLQVRWSQLSGGTFSGKMYSGIQVWTYYERPVNERRSGLSLASFSLSSCVCVFSVVRGSFTVVYSLQCISCEW